ncbi:hypothetical protein I4U23_009020 [Adineta vaga]|nr:hypothetical protein I4U23_009020 [Adineta vaga]
MGATTTPIPGTVQRINETRTRQPVQSSARLGGNIVTNQGLPDSDMTQTMRIDPKTNLVRDPAERNIPKLIVDDSVIRQSVRTSNGDAMNSGSTFDQTNRYNQLNNGTMSMDNRHINGDIINRTKHYNSEKQRSGMYPDDEQKIIDDRWKKEVFIDDQGVVSIEPVVYEEPVYDGPFGLTRTGSYIFYIGMAIFTLLAAIFLIMCGIFYAQNYPSASTNAGKLAGIGICAFAFYLGLQLILIGIWHQKHRKENPRPIVKPSHQEYSQAHTKSNKPNTADNFINNNNDNNYPYQTQPDYASYGNYPNTAYAPYGNEQILLQNGSPGTVMYPPPTWTVNGESEGAQMDPRFLQPMEWIYGSQTMSEAIPTSEQPTTNSANVKSEKRKSEKRSHKKKMNAVEVDVTKRRSNDAIPKSTVIEPPLPRMNKAPETKELIEQNAELEKNMGKTSTPSSLTVQNVSQIKSMDDDIEISSLANHRHRHSDRYLHPDDRSRRNHHHHHHQQQQHQHRSHYYQHHRRHQSHSPCSICSRDEFYSDVGYNHHGHHHHHHLHHTELIPGHFVLQPTPTHMRSSTKLYRDSGVATEHQLKIMKDSSVTADLEDITNDHNNSLHQVPIVRRTVIVEPYPAEPSTQIIVTPRMETIRKFRSDDNLHINEDHEKILYPRPPSVTKKTKRKKSTTESRDNILEDLNLEDVNETEYSSRDSRKRRVNKIPLTKTASNAFYDN